MVDIEKMDQCREFFEFQIKLYNDEDAFVDEMEQISFFTIDCDFLFKLTARETTINDMVDCISGNDRGTTNLFEEIDGEPLTYEVLRQQAVLINESENKVIKAATADQVSISLKELKSDAGFDKKNSEKKYRVKESWIFNLESMYDKLSCVLLDIQDGEITLPIEICGSKIESEEDVEALIEEASKLELVAKSRKVTSKEYGRIEQLVNWRIMQRYARCLSNGMDEKDAGECFREL